MEAGGSDGRLREALGGGQAGSSTRSKRELTVSQARGAGPGHPGEGRGRAATRSGATSVDTVSRPRDVELGSLPQPRPLGACPRAIQRPDLVRGLRGVRARRRPAGGWGRCSPASPGDRAALSAPAGQRLHVFRVPHGGHLRPQHCHRQQADHHGPPGGRAGPGRRGRGPARRVQHVR